MNTQRRTRHLMDYEVLPRVVPTGEKRTIRIRPLGAHVALEEGAEYSVRVLPMEQNIQPRPLGEFPCAQAVARQGMLCFDWLFDREQEHRLHLYRKGADARICELCVYALDSDLYTLRPYRGDLHVHTHHSDGHEAPAVVAANYRRAGFDFMGITDHHQYAPSLEAIEAYRDLPIDLCLFPGEEVHPPDSHIHIVNFGGSFSLNDIFREDPDGYASQVAEVERSVYVPKGVNRHEAAVSVWAFNKIREGGGLAIFPHPHWNYSVYHVPDAMSKYLFETRAFDAFELIGGQDGFSNNMQSLFYGEMRANGIDVPVVGSSDSHGTVNCDWFNWMQTIVFAPDPSWDSLRESILAKRSVAMETYPGEQPRFYGGYRYAKFAMFLWRTYYVFHDELCFEEGRLMRAAVTGGGEQETALLRAMRGRVAAMTDRWYGKTE